MEKVKLPREVAEAIGNLLLDHHTWKPADLFYVILNPSSQPRESDDEAFDIIRKFSHTRELKIAEALLNGYEVELTPEDKAVEWFSKTYHSASARTIVQNIAKILNGEEADF